MSKGSIVKKETKKKARDEPDAEEGGEGGKEKEQVAAGATLHQLAAPRRTEQCRA